MSETPPEKRIPFCLPLQLASKAKILDAITEYSKLYPYFEIWLDYIEDLDSVFIRKLLTRYGNTLIYIFRRDAGGGISLAREKRREYMGILAEKDAIVDFDITVQREDLEYVMKKGLSLSLITSYHNYQKTPDDPELSGILTEMDKFSPYIYKFSTHCNIELDALRLLKLGLRLRQRGSRHICVGMGQLGKITRISGALWGQEIVFAPVLKEQASAPGQIPIQRFQQILTLLDHEHAR